MLVDNIGLVEKNKVAAEKRVVAVDNIEMVVEKIESAVEKRVAAQKNLAAEIFPFPETQNFHHISVTEETSCNFCLSDQKDHMKNNLDSLFETLFEAAVT